MLNEILSQPDSTIIELRRQFDGDGYRASGERQVGTVGELRKELSRGPTTGSGDSILIKHSGLRTFPYDQHQSYDPNETINS